MSKGNKTSSSEIVSQLTKAREIIDQCLNSLATGSVAPQRVTKKSVNATPVKLNFTLNERHFISTYGKGLSGPKKFVLLLARETKGVVGVEIELATLRTKWNKMTAKNLMGYDFNLFYPNDAKTRGWIDSKKPGKYHLCSNWMDIFK